MTIRPGLRRGGLAVVPALLRRTIRCMSAIFVITLAAATYQDPPTAIALDAPASDPRPGGTPAAAFDRPFFAGVYLGDAETQPEQIQSSIDAFAGLVGKRPALVKTFHTIEGDFSARGWNGQLLRKVDAAGATNFVALDLRWPHAPAGGLLAAINTGAADADFVRLAREFASLPFVVLLSPGWEMNGNWNGYTWQGVENGNEKGPEQYVAAWRRIVHIFRREGASNVEWVFSPNVGNALTNQATGSSHWNWYAHYYPGDDYVDYLGPHGFNGSGVWGGPYKGFGRLFDGAEADHLLSDLERRYPTKPIIVGEFASEELAAHDKGEWISGAFVDMRRHPNVIGAIWFNMKKEADWRIGSSSGSLAAYRAAMADPNVSSSFHQEKLPARLTLEHRRPPPAPAASGPPTDLRRRGHLPWDGMSAGCTRPAHTTPPRGCPA